MRDDIENKKSEASQNTDVAAGGRTKQATSRSVEAKQDVPEIIRAAGDVAVFASCEFLDDPWLSTNTRRVYGGHVRQFCRWANARRLRLTLIAEYDVAAYIEPFSSHATYDAVTVLRKLFRHLIAAGCLTETPCGRRGRPRRT